MVEKLHRVPKPLELAENLASRIQALADIKDANKRGLAMDLLRDLADHIVRLPTSMRVQVSRELSSKEDRDSRLLGTAHMFLKEAQSRLPKPRIPIRKR